MRILGGYFEPEESFMLKACPELCPFVDQKDIQSKNVVRRAAGKNLLNVVTWAAGCGFPLRMAACSAAAFGGHLEMLELLRELKVPIERKVAAKAASGGHLNVLRFCHEVLRLDLAGVCFGAAAGGHVHVLEWLQTNNLFARNDRYQIAHCAAYGGKVEVLKWLDQLHWNISQVRDAAVEGGHLSAVQWLWARGFVCADICDVAAKFGHLPILIWAHDQGFPWTSNTLGVAAGHDVFSYLVGAGCPWGDNTSTRLIENGQPELVRAAIIEGKEVIDRHIVTSAVQSGYLDFAEWAAKRGFPLEENTVRAAAVHGDIKLLDFCLRHDAPGLYTVCRITAANGHLPALQWAREHKLPWDSTAQNTARTGHLEILQWARANGCPWDVTTTFAAVTAGKFEILRWAILNGCKYDEYVAKKLREAFPQYWCPLEWALETSKPRQPTADAFIAGAG